jgi:hypothetical protein
MAQRQLRLAEKRHAGFGGRDALGGALQQPGGKLALKPADLLAQRRLHQVQVQRRAADAAEFDHPHKIPQLPQFHGRSAL